ncbi:DMT family transporter [Nocardiopsis trehalosi]|jgi:drug/metabolite transporter (DMT)-like permease|uniref:DMT family transporter n=1 Tax=Nocardiopsis trehalosi TaxID=109329 RepID=UPI000B07074E|nr:DMT family transporter [Nocardiopsis trehalosi]
MSGFGAAVALAVASALCYGAGAVAQRRLAGRFEDASGVRYLAAVAGHRAWWGAMALNGAGALLHVAALAWGPLTVVQPLGTLALVFALPWAAREAARRVTPREWHGAILTVAALSVMLVVAVPTGGHALGRAAAFALLGAVLLVVGLLVAAAWRATDVRWRSQFLSAAAGVAFGAASALTTALIDVAATDGWAAAAHPAALGTAVLAGAGALLSQAAYRGVAVGAPLATMSLANPLAAVLVGIAFLGETYAGGTWGAGVAILTGMMAIRGVHLLAGTTPPLPHRPVTASAAHR